MDLANVPERTLSVCEKKGDILPLMFIRMLFFLLVILEDFYNHFISKQFWG